MALKGDEKHEIICWLDTDDQHPRLLGDCILPRDFDGIGFSLSLDELKRRYVRITIETIDASEDGKPLW